VEDSLPVAVVDMAGLEHEWQLKWRSLDEEYMIDISQPESGRAWSARGYDLFDAFRKLRLQLEPIGVRVCVSGARTDAYSSGMLRDMGGGQMVYLLRKHGLIGRSFRFATIRRRKAVYIFSSAPCNSIGSVDEQKDYFEKWCNYEI
jgi:hypothetical protein